MELPQKIRAKPRIEQTVVMLVEGYNEILSYLESQKEGEAMDKAYRAERLTPQQLERLKAAGSYQKKEPKHTDGICQACRPKEEPKQIDVESLLEEYYLKCKCQ
jgi:hypothetical protein